MGEVITFLKRIPEDDRASIVGRAWGKFCRRRHYLETEIARMQQAGCSYSEIEELKSDHHKSGSRPQLSLSDCRELGIPVNGDVVIDLGARRGSK